MSKEDDILIGIAAANIFKITEPVKILFVEPENLVDKVLVMFNVVYDPNQFFDYDEIPLVQVQIDETTTKWMGFSLLSKILIIQDD